MRTISPKPASVSTRRRRQLLTLGLLAASILAITLSFVRFNPFSDTSTVYAEFDNARGVARAGLKTTTAVRLNGATVGNVSSIERDGDRAVFKLSLDPEAARALRADATAELRPRTPFEGNSYIDLAAGHSARQLAGRISLGHTRNYVSLYEALSFADAQTRTTLRNIARETSLTLQADGRQGLQSTLRALPRLTQHLRDGARALSGPNGRSLASLVDGAAGTMRAVAAEQASLNPFLAHTAATFNAFNTQQGRALDSALRAFPAALTALQGGSAGLRRVLDAVDPLARDLVPGMRALGPALRRSGPFITHGAPALRRSGPLVAQLRGALQQLAVATPTARRLLKATEPTASVLNSSLLAALHRETPVGLPAYLAVMNTLQGASNAFAAFQTPAQGKAPGQLGHGHFLNFEGRFYTGYATPDLPPCSLIGILNKKAAAQLGQFGVCTP